MNRHVTATRDAQATLDALQAEERDNTDQVAQRDGPQQRQALDGAFGDRVALPRKDDHGEQRTMPFRVRSYLGMRM